MATFSSNWKFETLTPGASQSGAGVRIALEQWQAGQAGRSYSVPASGLPLVAQLTADTTDAAARRDLESCSAAQGLRAIHYPG